MSINSRRQQESPGPEHEALVEDNIPVDSLPGRWSSRVFYGVSALLHIAAVVALSGAWVWHTEANKAQAETVVASPATAAVARMAIDVGPIKFCEMKIETLVGRPQKQPGH